jgi:hypothetical protein
MPACPVTFFMVETKTMGTKHLKFVSITEAITEKKNTLLMQSELNKREELGPLLMVYSEIEWVNASVAEHPKTGVTGLLVETEMEKFKCVQSRNN